MPEVTVRNRPEKKLDQFYSKQKDKLDNDKASDVVYQLDCVDCDAIYMGETKQKTGVPKQQHKNSVSSAILSKQKEASALALHTKTTSHQFDFDNIKILERNSNKRKLQIDEVNHIIMNQERTCNYKKDTANIGPSYFNLLRQHANKDNRMAPTVPYGRTMLAI